MRISLRTLLLALSLLAGVIHAHAQSTAFTYQGRFNTNGAPYTGSAEFQFTLWDALSGGNAVATNNPVAVIASVTDGLFTATLDFGNTPFNGQPRFLQIDARTGISAFTTLTPRQPLTPTPYALRALNLTTNGLTAGTYTSAVTFNNAGNSFAGAFIGNGGGLTNVNAATLGGLNAASFWKTNGNAGANPTNGAFLGNADNLPLEFKVNSQRALRLEPTGSPNTPNVIAGSPNNFASPFTYGGTIGGGGGSLLGLHTTNRVSGFLPTVSGGGNNVASGNFSTVAGGRGNLASGPSSFVAGESCEASGTNAVAFGYNTAASGFASTAMGLNSWAGDDLATAMGNNTLAAGNSSTAMGSGAKAQGDSSTAMGENTVASGFASTAMGDSTIASGSGSTAIGNSTWASGTDSTAMGKSSTATGFASTAMGHGANASAQASTAMGYETEATGIGSTAMGYRARALQHGSFVWADFQAADFASTADNQFSIRASGGVRLSDDTPALSFGNEKRQMVNLHGTAHAIGVQNSTTYFRSSSRFSWFRDGTHTDTENSPGSGGAVAMTLTSGGLTVNGVVVSSSDRNVKAGFESVDPLTILAKVVALPIQRWHFTNDVSTPHLGPMAQDFHAAFQVGEDDKHIATVDADGVALAAIQGLNQKLEATRAENADLKRRLEALEKILQEKSR